MSAALFFNYLFIDDLFLQYAISDKGDDDGVTMETMNINSVSVVMDDSSTTFSVTQQQDNQLLLVSNRQSRDIIDSSNQHQPMKMVDPIEVFKQTVGDIPFPSLSIFSRVVFALLSRARLECRKVIQPQGNSETEAAKFLSSPSISIRNFVLFKSFTRKVGIEEEKN